VQQLVLLINLQNIIIFKTAIERKAETKSKFLLVGGVLCFLISFKQTGLLDTL
jgi:hypothetical protein